MKTSPLYQLLKFAALAGNLLFILWMLYNGVDEGFRATPYQLASYVGLTLLLLLNSILIFAK